MQRGYATVEFWAKSNAYWAFLSFLLCWRLLVLTCQSNGCSHFHQGLLLNHTTKTLTFSRPFTLKITFKQLLKAMNSTCGKPHSVFLTLQRWLACYQGRTIGNTTRTGKCCLHALHYAAYPFKSERTLNQKSCNKFTTRIKSVLITTTSTTTFMVMERITVVWENIDVIVKTAILKSYQKSKKHACWDYFRRFTLC